MVPQVSALTPQHASAIEALATEQTREVPVPTGSPVPYTPGRGRRLDPGYRARPERAILFSIEAWDVNCSQHITARYSEEEVAGAVAGLRDRIAALETENAELRTWLGQSAK